MLSVNPALASMHGYDSPEEMVTTIMDLGHQSLWPQQRVEFRGELEEDGVARGQEYQVYRQDSSNIGSRWMPERCGRKRNHHLLRRFYPGHHGTKGTARLIDDLPVCPTRF